MTKYKFFFKPKSVSRFADTRKQLIPCPGKSSPPGVGEAVCGLYLTCDQRYSGQYTYTRTNTHRKKCHVYGIGTLNIQAKTADGKCIELFYNYTIRVRASDSFIEAVEGQISSMTVNGKSAQGKIKFCPAEKGDTIYLCIY